MNVSSCRNRLYSFFTFEYRELMKNLWVIFFLCANLFASEGKKEFRLPSYETVLGETIPNVKIGYESYGKLNPDKSNVILVTHHFSGNSHAIGYWESIIGPGKALDTNKYFIISSDTLVNLGGIDPQVITTGPRTINPKTKKPYGMTFPKIVLKDFVRVQRELLNSLGIKKLYAVVGASSGAAQAISWAAYYPEDVPRAIAVIPPGLSLPPYVVAMLNRWMAPILLNPKKGLVESLKQITQSSVYFDWNPSKGSVEDALEERALLRAKTADAESLLYTARAIQAFNVEAEAQNIKAQVLFIPAEKDMIFPAELSDFAATKLCSMGKSAEVVMIKGREGHLDGLTRIGDVSKEISQFLERSLEKNYCK